MKFTSYFAFAIVSMCTLSVVLAENWAITMSCGESVEMRLEHMNQFASQVIKWDPNVYRSDNIVCSEDQVVCIKNVYALRDGCTKVTFNFMVQFGNVWSLPNVIEVEGIITVGDPLTVSDIYKFQPVYAPWLS